jgi:hypothetical protein
MNNINEQLNTISEAITTINTTVNSINQRLEELIKALHEYDDNDYGESSFEAFMDDEEAANKRMDIIGQNGNEGSHYVTNEEADDDARSNNIQTKHVGEKMIGGYGVPNNVVVGEPKKRNKRYYKPKAK